MSALAAAPLTRRYTIEEYLALERETGEKYEFFDGEVYLREAMAGSTLPHARIANRTSTLLENALPDECYTLSSDAKLSIPPLRRYRYPDLSVICGPPEYDVSVSHAALNPVALAEVTSDSSKDADYTSKAKQYMEHIPSLRDYLVVVQDERFITLFSRKREGDAWTVKHYGAGEQTVTIESVDVTLDIDDIYRNIYWEDGKTKLGIKPENPLTPAPPTS